MALFYRNRPDEHADATEKIVAEYLAALGNDWIIIWGYYYLDAHQVQREGDFLIYGPTGQILVMEVKGGQNRQFVLTGEWEHSRDGDNPHEQLMKQFSWVRDKIEDVQQCEYGPWVGRALCMPNLNMTGEERLCAHFQTTELILRKDLETFETWWNTRIAKHTNRCENPKASFMGAFLAGKKPTGPDLFIKETDRILDRYRNLNSDYLEMLNGNARWVVEGGPGSGKTFLAVQRAKQLAETGKRVLFLCFNLILADHLNQLVERLSLSAGSITVKSWEAVVKEILAAAGIEMEVPKDSEQRTRYYEEEIPFYVGATLKDNPPERSFDALVVDEAQDHDTAFKELPNLADGHLAWWSWYFALLRNPETAPVSIFLDVYQRQAFRDPARFNLNALRDRLGNHAHFRLITVRRYTSKIDAFLRSFDHSISQPYPDLQLPEPSLPIGPEVICSEARPQETADAISEIIDAWIGQKLCKVDDIIILGHRSRLESSSIGQLESISGHTLCNYTLNGPRGQLRYLCLHRAKGLDFLGVILIDIKEDVPNAQQVVFAGATRARQLLAIIRPVSSDTRGD